MPIINKNSNKNNQFLQSIKATKNWLTQIKIRNYVIDPNTLMVNIFQDVNIQHMDLDVIPVKFKTVYGSFKCGHNNLTTLKGAPQVVGGNFVCYYNNLTTLEEGPTAVKGNFWCDHNNLSTLEGAPTAVDGNLWCNHNQLITLKGAPQYIGDVILCHANLLTSLEGIPDKKYQILQCQDNLLTSLKGAPSSLIHFAIDCNTSTLTNINKFVKHATYLSLCNISENLSGLLKIFLIKDLQEIDINIHTPEHQILCDIINKHLENGKSGPACQLELIDAGLSKYIKM